MALNIRSIPTTNFTPSTSRPIDLIVIHTMEAPESSGRAAWCAKYFAGLLGKAPKASAHYCVDNAEIVQGVSEANVAWAAPGANHDGIQIENAGYAGQGKDGWNDAYSLAELDLLARLVADIATRRGIPIVKLGPADLKAGKRGICGHVDASLAFHLSDHGDPGKDFPWDAFITKVRSYAGQGAASAAVVKPSTPGATAGMGVLKVGSKGDAVKRLQEGALRVFPSYATPIKTSGGADGIYGAGTESFVREFQRRTHLTIDGIVGPATRAELAKYGVTL